MEEYPSMTYDGKTYYQIGCAKCQNSRWDIFTLQGVFLVRCMLCGHTIDIHPKNVRTEPDPERKTLKCPDCGSEEIEQTDYDQEFGQTVVECPGCGARGIISRFYQGPGECPRMIPAYMIESLQRYVDQRTPPGGFLRAVLENDLATAFGRADDENRKSLHDIVQYIWNELPSSCWGSKEKFHAWVNGKPED